MDAHIIDLPKHLDDRGNLSYIQNTTHLPFTIRRVYWIYDVPGGEARGGHAFRNTEEFIVALSGSFEVVVDDGRTRQVFSLNRSYYGLYVPKGVWREIRDFSTNAVAMEFASTDYDPADYIRDYDEFLKSVNDAEI